MHLVPFAYSYSYSVAPFPILPSVLRRLPFVSCISNTQSINDGHDDMILCPHSAACPSRRNTMPLAIHVKRQVCRLLKYTEVNYHLTSSPISNSPKKAFGGTVVTSACIYTHTSRIVKNPQPKLSNHNLDRIGPGSWKHSHQN